MTLPLIIGISNTVFNTERTHITLIKAMHATRIILEKILWILKTLFFNVALPFLG